MPIKLIALDLDGTLLDNQKRISEKNRTAVCRAIDNGVQFVFCTGRTRHELAPYAEQLPAIRYGVCCNGAYVVDLREGELLYEEPIPIREVRHLHTLLADLPQMFEFFTTTEITTAQECLDHPEQYGVGYLSELLRSSRTGVNDLEQFLAAQSRPAGKINIFFPSAALRDEAWNRVKDLPYDLSTQEPTNLEFNRKGINKGYGILSLAKSLDIPTEEILAIGDSTNDIPMFEVAGVSVAMANASLEVRSKADYLTKTNQEDGVAFLLENRISLHP